MPADGQPLDEAYDQAARYSELVPIWGRPTPFYALAEEIMGSWGENFIRKLTREKGMCQALRAQA